MRFLQLTLIFCILCSFTAPISAQDFGAYPSGSKWKQINTSALRVIYPEVLESEARQVAATITHIESSRRETIGQKKWKLDLILNNYGVMSNGYVTLAPFRSEFFTAPYQDADALGSLNWLHLLSIHEYRHALQYMNMKKGLFGIGNMVFGQGTLAVLMNLTVPNWYFEGDAVATETAFTLQGRGRIPSFHKGYKTIVLEDEKLSYEKARNGSLNDIVPDHYELGYLLTAYGRENYGNDLWMNVINRTTRLKGIIYPFSQGLQMYMGKKSSGLFRLAMDSYREKWASELAQVPITPSDTLNQPQRDITHYRYPYPLANNRILVRKSSFSRNAGLVIVDQNGNEEFLTYIGLSDDGYYHTNGKQAVWTTISWHPRYSALNYHDVVLFDMEQKTKRFLVKDTRLASPALSSDGSRIVAVDIRDDHTWPLVILNAQNGDVISSHELPDNWYPSYPRFDHSDQKIICPVRNNVGEMAIASFDPKTGKTSLLMEFVNQVIGAVDPHKEYLLFSAPLAGTDNIYALKSNDKKIYQVSSVPYGAYDPVIDHTGRQIIYSDYRRRGHILSAVQVNETKWKAVKPIGLHEIASLNPAWLSSEGGVVSQDLPAPETLAKPYHPLAHLIRIHSWSIMPGFDKISLSVHSNDVMSQLSLQAGYDYYFNEQSSGFNLSALYGGFFPLIGITAGRQYRNTSVSGVGDQGFRDDYLDLGLSLPLNFTRGNRIRTLDLSTNYSFKNVSRVGAIIDGGIRSYYMNSLGFSLNAVNKQPAAKKQLTTPFGQALQVSLNQSIGSIFASQFQAIGDLALRGIAPTHNLTFTAGFKFEDWRNDYRFLDLFVYPRGYSIPATNWMFTIQTGYHFPIFYPDFGLIGIFYLERVRSTLFADLGVADVVRVEGDQPTDGYFTSMGAELIFDTKWLNLLPISMGMRTSLLLNRDQFNTPVLPIRIEFVLPVFRL